MQYLHLNILTERETEGERGGGEDKLLICYIHFLRDL